MSSVFQAAATAIIVWIGFALLKEGFAKIGKPLNFKVAWAGISYWIIYALCIGTSMQTMVGVLGIFFAGFSFIIFLCSSAYRFILNRRKSQEFTKCLCGQALNEQWKLCPSCGKDISNVITSETEDNNQIREHLNGDKELDSHIESNHSESNDAKSFGASTNRKSKVLIVLITFLSCIFLYGSYSLLTERFS